MHMNNTTDFKTLLTSFPNSEFVQVLLPEKLSSNMLTHPDQTTILAGLYRRQSLAHSQRPGSNYRSGQSI